MEISAEAAEETMKLGIEGTKVAYNMTKKGIKDITPLLAKTIKNVTTEQNRTKGEIRLKNMLKSGKRLEIFVIPDENLKQFSDLAKTYGVLYTVVKDPKRNDGITELFVRSDDSPKINHIFRRMDLNFQSLGELRPDLKETVKENEKAMKKAPSVEKEETEIPLSKVIQGAKENMEPIENPTTARSAESLQSVPSSSDSLKQAVSSDSKEKKIKESKPSVREKLKKAKKTVEKETVEKSKIKEKTTKTKGKKRSVKKSVEERI